MHAKCLALTVPLSSQEDKLVTAIVRETVTNYNAGGFL